MAIKYLAGESPGVSFETEEGKVVGVKKEKLSRGFGVEGDTIIYTAEVKDNVDIELPDTFVIDLKINGTNLITGQALDATVYDPATFHLTLPWVVPAGIGNFIVKLSWAEQVI